MSKNPADDPPDYGDAEVEKIEPGPSARECQPTPSYGDKQSSKIEFVMSPREDDKGPISETWFVSNWRPSMAWLYMAIIAFDFIIAPILSMMIPLLPFVKGLTYVAWAPLTLQGGGMIHITFGAVLGITAWGRTKEKTTDTSDSNGG